MSEERTAYAVEQTFGEVKERVIDESQPSSAARLVKLSSGVQVVIRRMNLNVANKVMDSVTLPDPPVMEVERPDGTREKVANTLDPAYQQLAGKHEQSRLMKLISFASGLYIRLWNEGQRGLTDEQLAELSALEEAMRESAGAELDGRSTEAKYICNCAFSAASDYTLAMNALFAQPDDPK